MFKQICWLIVPICLLIGSVGCSKDAVENGPSLDDDLVTPNGKFDSGYYSNLAVELEGEFVATAILDLTDLTEEQRTAKLEKYQEKPNLARFYALDQIKLAKNQLHANKLHINLLGGEFEVLDLALNDTELTIRYRMQADTLVTYKELEELDVSAQELLDKSYDVTIPADPRDLFSKYGETCASGHDPGHLAENSFFYYFDPHVEGCDLAMSPEASFTVHSLLPQTQTYPEFDKLVEDGRLEIVIFFGAAETVPYGGDWGVMVWRSFEVDIRLRGFEKIDSDLLFGQRYQREVNGLVEVIDLISPYDIHSLGQDSDAFFGEMFHDHEIVFYNGHSFYGSLNVLNARENYPENGYQILFMNSCWSYEYYTKQVFDHKITDEDPRGWDLGDVVNNTQPAYFSQMHDSSRVLLFNLLIGAEGMGKDDQGRHFSWQNIIAALNDSAQGKCPWDIDEPSDCRFFFPKESKHEVYGVAGVRTNSFTP